MSSRDKPNAAKKRRVAVLGSRSVGKSSLVKQFVHNDFVDSYYPTIESTYTKNMVYNGVDYECEIVDTPGQDEFTILNTNYAIGIHGYVLVYSIAARKSFDMISIIHDKILNCCGVAKMPCVIVGSKCDLTSSQRRVEPKEGEDLAKELECNWIETSAKNNINIDRVFELCLEEIEKNFKQPDPGPAPTQSCTMQ